MNRRDLFTAGAGMVFAQALASTVACADDPAPSKPEAKSDDHAHHHHAPGGVKHAAFVATVHECLAAADICLQHCLELLAGGDTTMERCSQTVNQMRAVCHATSVIAAADSKHLQATLALCIQLCNDCEEACREHEDKHEACKNCAEACKKTADGAKALKA